MGAVFVAEHLRLHKLVALKIVRADVKVQHSEVAIRLAREAMATARLEHPHVASSIDYGSLPEGGTYFVMQLVRGTSLRRMLAGSRRMPWPRACEIAAQVADALSATRAAGIVHRDLKPDNILVEVREDGSDLVKVLDFGIAQVSQRVSSLVPGAEPERQITVAGTVMGTPGYMAPEQAVGDKVDPRADLYSLGVVLWECIAGRELWVGPDLTSLVSRQMSESVPSLRQLGIDPSLPAQLDELIQSLTERQPGSRPEHPSQVRDALRRMARSHASVAPQPALAVNAEPNDARGGSPREEEAPASARKSGAPRPGVGRRRRSSSRPPRESRRPPRRRVHTGLSFWFAALVLAAVYLAARTFFPQLHAQAASEPPRANTGASAPTENRTALTSAIAPEPIASEAVFCTLPQPESIVPADSAAPPPPAPPHRETPRRPRRIRITPPSAPIAPEPSTDTAAQNAVRPPVTTPPSAPPVAPPS